MTWNMSLRRAITAIVALVFLGTALPAWCGEPAAAARLPVPADGQVAESRKLIRDAYDTDYKTAKESGEPAALLDKLRNEADAAPELAKKYAFLLEAEDVAAQHDDAAATLALVDRRAELFDIDCLAERSKTLVRLAGPKIAADLVLLEQATATATKAAAAERFDIATESTSLAIKIAQAIDREQKAAARRRQQRRPAVAEVLPAANGVALIKSAVDLQKQIGKQKELFTKYEEAKALLATQPDDPAANAAAGTYLCFVARNWEQGLPHLKKSSHPAFGKLAAEELALKDMASADSAKLLSLAGKWWDLAEGKTLSDEESAAVRHHARRLYAAVRPRLTDLLEIRVAETRGGKGSDPGPGPKGTGFKSYRLVAKISHASEFETYYRTIEFFDAATGRKVTGGKASGTGTGAPIAFDDDRETSYRSLFNPGVAGDWIAYEMPKPAVINRVRVIQIGGHVNHVFQFEIHGSNDGAHWTTVMRAKGVPEEFDSADPSAQVEWLAP